MLAVIRNPELVREFEREQMRASPPNHEESLRIFEALWEHARNLGVLPLKDPLEGIEVDVRLAEALNVQRSSGEDRSGA